MDFPIIDLLDDELSSQWLLKYFNVEGLKCPHCGQGLDQAREFRQTKTSQLTVYGCTACQGIYNLYSRTVFEGRYFRPAQAVLLLRGVTKGDPSAEIAREIEGYSLVMIPKLVEVPLGHGSQTVVHLTVVNLGSL